MDTSKDTIRKPEDNELLKTLISSIDSDLCIFRPNEFIESDTFLNNISPSTLSDILIIGSAGKIHPPAVLYGLQSESERISYIRHGNRDVLQRAIEFGAMAVRYLNSTQPDRGNIICQFARALKLKWKAEGDNRILDDAIYFFRKAAEVGDSNVPDHALTLEDLATVLWDRYTLNPSDADYEETLECFKRAASYEHHGKPMYLSNIGRVLKERASTVAEERESLLDESITWSLKAVSCDLSQLLVSRTNYIYMNLVQAYFLRHSLDPLDPIASLDKSIIDVTCSTEEHRWHFYHQLSSLYVDRFKRLANHSDVDVALALLRTALSDAHNNPTLLSSLGDTLLLKALSDDSQTDMSLAVQNIEAALAATPETSFEWPERAKKCSMGLFNRFKMTGSLDDLEKAIPLLRKAVDFIFLNTTEKWDYYRCLGLQYNHLFQAKGNQQDLDEAEKCLESALANPGLPEIWRASCLREHGKILFEKYKIDSSDEHLAGALSAYEEAINLSGPVDPAVVHYHNDLANALEWRFMKTGSPEDARKTIDHRLRSLSLLKSSPSLEVKRDTAMLLTNLANTHVVQYERFNQISTLDLAIQYYKEAMNETSRGDAMYGPRSGGLSWALQLKYDAGKDVRVLEDARTWLLTALDANGLERSSQLPLHVPFLRNRLGSTYLREFLDSSPKDAGLLDKALEHFTAGVIPGNIDADHGVSCMVNLALAAKHKFDLTKKKEDLFYAVKQFREASKMISRSRPNVQRLLMFHGGSLFLSLFEADQSADKNEFGVMAIRCLVDVRDDTSARADVRAHAATRIAHLVWKIHGDAYAAADDYVLAIRLLPEVILLSPNRADVLRLVQQFTALARYALGFILATSGRLREGDGRKYTVEYGIQLFERARCIVWDRLIDLKSDISELKEMHEEVASRFEKLRTRLSRFSPVHGAGAVDNIEQFEKVRERQEYQDLAIDYNRILEEIREKEGFADFLLVPEDTSRLQDYASAGPIIIINCTQYAGQAVLLSSNGVKHIKLPLMTNEACSENLAKLRKALDDIESGSRNQKVDDDKQSYASFFESVLIWLWEAIAKPVLEVLGFTGSSVNNQEPFELPRIWWMMNDWMSQFPIHAAGDHRRALETGECCTVLDRAVSSYTPTLKALALSRKTAADLPRTALKEMAGMAVLVQMATTPDMEDLPGAAAEVESISRVLDRYPAIATHALDHPKRRDVLPYLVQCRLAHFACHALSSPRDRDPSLSAILLEDWRSAPLDVRALLRLQMKNCELVYLSACGTARSQDVFMRDELVHVAAAVHVGSGAPRVVGTMWNVEDSVAGKVAKCFYEGLNIGGDILEFNRSAHALRETVKKLRGEGIDASLWGAFIHLGA